MSWSADSVDCVMFMPPVPGIAPDALQPWLKVFSSPPRSYQGPVAGAGPGPVAQAFGPVGEYVATLTAQLGRIELKLSATAPGAGGQVGTHLPQSRLPVIEDVPPALETLISYAQQLLVGYNPARIGLVLNLSRAEASARGALESFQAGLPISGELPDHATDLNFALNLQCTSALSDGTSPLVNRLCRWGVARRQVMMVTINIGGGTPAPVFKTDESFASTLQIDINAIPQAIEGTVATWSPDLALEMFTKFRTIAMPIFEYGYEGLLHS